MKKIIAKCLTKLMQQKLVGHWSLEKWIHTNYSSYTHIDNVLYDILCIAKRI